MPRDLVRYQQAGHLHFITFSCYHRLPHLATREAQVIFEEALERMRLRYGFYVVAYVVMPEHVHLLVSEPPTVLLSRALQALRLSVAVQRSERPFWQARPYDFNVFSEEKIVEKRRYIHRNPVKRGLVAWPELWDGSSFMRWWKGERGIVEIESHWTARRRLNPSS